MVVALFLGTLLKKPFHLLWEKSKIPKDMVTESSQEMPYVAI